MSAPFGIEIGEPLDTKTILEELQGGKAIVAPAKAHPSFQQYIVDSSPQHGVFWIKAIGVPVENDGYGTQVRDQIERLTTQLTSNYGQAAIVDVRDPNGIWSESKDWVMAIDQSERSYFRSWDRAQGASLPDDIQSIFLGLATYSMQDSAMVLEYSSTKFDEAEAANDADLSGIL